LEQGIYDQEALSSTTTDLLQYSYLCKVTMGKSTEKFLSLQKLCEVFCESAKLPSADSDETIRER
jgi:hypothetical protein